MVDTIIEGKMTVESLIELINEHYKKDDTLSIWARLRKQKE